MARVERIAVANADRKAVGPAEVCALRITTPTGIDYYVSDLRQSTIGPANGRVKCAAPVETDGRAAVVRLADDGRLIRASAVGASFLKLNGQTIWCP